MFSSMPCKRASREERSWQKDGRRGLSVVTVSPLRRPLTGVPSTDTDYLRHPFYLASSRKSCPDSRDPYSTYPEGARSDEYSAPPRHQRHHRSDRPRDYRCDSRWPARSKQVSTVTKC